MKKDMEQEKLDSNGLLSIGRKFMDDSEYLEAEVIFKKLHKTGGESMKEISSLYDFLIYSLIGRIPNDIIIDGVIRCMTTSTEMHAEKNISLEDLLTIETLIDRLPFSEMIIPGRDEFEKIYCRFKEYVTNIYVDNKK